MVVAVTGDVTVTGVDVLVTGVDVTVMSVAVTISDCTSTFAVAVKGLPLTFTTKLTL